MVERWFAELTEKRLRRGTHHSTKELKESITYWIDQWNDGPRPYVCTKADEILTTSPRIPSGSPIRTLAARR